MPSNTKKLMKEFEEGKYQKLLKDIYVAENVLEYQKERYIKALENFETLYGEKEIEIYSAPGRSEVGGNHTDHQYGKVLATSINLDAIAIVAKTEDETVTIKSEGYEKFEVHLSSLEPKEGEEGTSESLTRGVASKLKEEGYEIGGFEAYITSDVLNGAGMSSSAAFEVLLGNIFSGLYNDMKIDEVLIAQVGQYAENVFFGKPCGLMDQMASAVGGLINIDFEDPKNPIVKQVDVDFEAYGHSLCIVDTKGSHADLTDDYAAIPEEMKKVANFFDEDVLRKVDKNEFYLNLPKIREILGDRAVLRAMHLFEENKRVDEQVKALEDGDFETFKKLIKASGDSSFKYLQNVYSNHELQNQSMSIGLAISDVALGDKGVSRVHGGGFAGTIQAFVPNDIVGMYKETIENVFGEGACHILKVRKYGGIKVL
ncbi:galactokinase [Anaerostipes faecalis]|uniref:galactokinase n=1 Tax=Anaerostipes faecalis TaxID=2738446 RepID=UPI001C1E64B7|nr:galactokinase family protein [Anaerostipes faecalis]